MKRMMVLLYLVIVTGTTFAQSFNPATAINDDENITVLEIDRIEFYVWSEKDEKWYGDDDDTLEGEAVEGKVFMLGEKTLMTGFVGEKRAPITYKDVSVIPIGQGSKWDRIIVKSFGNVDGMDLDVEETNFIFYKSDNYRIIYQTILTTKDDLLLAKINIERVTVFDVEDLHKEVERQKKEKKITMSPEYNPRKL
jgi:hypothetical protein